MNYRISVSHEAVKFLTGSTVPLSAASGRGLIYCATIPSIRDFRRCSLNACKTP